MSLANAAAVLHWLKRGRPDVAVVELSTAMGWPKSTASRILKDMARLGLLERDETTRRYRPGLLMLELGRAYAASDPVLEAVDAELQEITRRTGYSTGISILDGIDIVVLRSRPGTHPLRVVTPPGTRGPAWANSTGRVLMTLLPDAEIARRFAVFPPRPRPNAPGTLEELMARVVRAKARGYDESDDESLPGLAGISVAVEDHDGKSGFAPYIAYSASQVEPKERAELAALLKDMVLRLDERFGRAQAPRRLANG
ncbi:IclR family transcriptional regulator [Phreatobacter sp.]|uniref:IclR family transcriptional regulator n=1 Tax=Phreatobacter sp. TaxID=1966341 RepID=UPI003F729DB4